MGAFKDKVRTFQQSVLSKINIRITARQLTTYSPLWYLLTVGCVFYFSIRYAIREVYEPWGESIVWMNQFIAWTCLIQVMVNWLCLRLVSSAYKPSKSTERIRREHEQSNPDLSSDGIPYDEFVAEQKNTTGVWSVQTRVVGHGRGDNGTDRVRVAYNYWAWQPCHYCKGEKKPPRAHHCPLCGTCVLKRDHHCFFADACIGVRNQRHFLVFNFWAAFTTCYVAVHLVVYMFWTLWDTLSYADFFFPLAIIRWFLGYQTAYVVVVSTVCASLIFFNPTSVMFFYEQYLLVTRGHTSYERDNGLKVVNCGMTLRNVRGVLGKWWWVNFIFPIHLIDPPLDDGLRWDTIKVPS